jgi:DNA-binding NtrC family response regulator
MIQPAHDVQTKGSLEKTAACRVGTAEQPFAGRETILFVEDEAFVRDVTTEVLRSAGYNVLTANDAAAAARMYDQRNGDVDLLLTDVVLTGESGRVFAERLKRNNPGLKVLLITGYAEQMGLQENETGACLPKPFSIGVLLRRVKQALEGDGVAERGTSSIQACLR